MQLTAQQQDFVTALCDTDDNLALVARAGCGKTSTILAGVAEYLKKNPQGEIIVCAFNKAIAEEVSGKLSKRNIDWKRARAATIHSLGFNLIKFAFKSAVDAKKVAKIIDQQNDRVYRDFRAQIADLVRYAKGAGFGFFSDAQISDKAAWFALADKFDVNGFDDDTTNLDIVVEAAQNIYRLSLADTSVVDYDDMILLPLVRNLRVKFPADLIIIDEAQDLSRARQALARKFVRPETGRMIVVGDDRQAIYGFAGADAESLANLIKALDAVVLPLNVTWRCPTAVVAEAQSYVNDIEAASGAAEGAVLRQETLPADLEPGRDAILCRNTAPLIEVAYQLIRAGIPAKVEGRAIGEGLIKLARRWKIKTISALLTKLADYREREIQKAMAKGRDDKAEAIADRVDTLVAICETCTQRGQTDIDHVAAYIDGLFADGADKAVVLATYHRCKGREWPRVSLYEHAKRCPSKFAKQAWQKVQEANLAYVAITRAQETLVYVGAQCPHPTSA